VGVVGKLFLRVSGTVKGGMLRKGGRLRVKAYKLLWQFHSIKHHLKPTWIIVWLQKTPAPFPLKHFILVVCRNCNK
jgi:hypothetical protein